jgi:hypothetical protein
MGHEYNKDKPFYFQINPNKSIGEIARELEKIESTPVDKLKEMSYNSKEFFELEIRGYFQDPTLKLIEWLRKDYE